MSFPQKIPSSELVMLSEEQQELVAGGVFSQPQVLEYSQIQHSNKSRKETEGQIQHLQGSTGQLSVFNSIFSLMPLFSQLIQKNELS